MKHKKWLWFALLLLLCAALPMAALATDMTAQDVWRETGLLLPLPADASGIAYAVQDGALAQVDFTYGDTMFVLRMQQTPAMQDVSDVREAYASASPHEEYAEYQCVSVTNKYDAIAWWFDAERSVSGMLRCASDASADFDLVLYEVFAGLRRGSSYAGSAWYEDGAFSLEYPLVQAEDEALTDKLNASMLEGVRAIAAAYASETRLDGASLMVDLTGKVFTAEWAGILIAPGAAYEEPLLFSVHVNCETGELAPLRSLVDTSKLATLTYPMLAQIMAVQDWDDDSVNDAQREYLQGISLDGWAELLERADLPCDEGWPPMFSSWRDGGYFRDGNEDEHPCLLLYLGVPPALQSQITLTIPFAQLQAEMPLTEALAVR